VTPSPQEDREAKTAGDFRRGAPVDTPGHRRLVTVLSYDLVDSTNLLHQSDLEDFRDLISAFQSVAQRAVNTHGGTLSDTLGDGGIALFASSADSRDAAAAAIRAGLELVEGCKRLATELNRLDLHVRTGIAASMVVVDSHDADIPIAKITGVAPALATRLQSIAEPDTVLVSDQAKVLAGRSHTFLALGKRRLKGFAEPESIWRASPRRLAIDRFFAFGHLNTPIVGRERELGEIGKLWHQVRAGTGAVLVIEGEAGIGKSRLVHEVSRSIRSQAARALVFQSAPSGTNSALHPLLGVLLNVRSDKSERLSPSSIAQTFHINGISDAEAIETFVFLLGASSSTDAPRYVLPEDIRQRAVWAAKRCIEQMCSQGPVFVVVEDAHWLDPTSIELLHAIVQSITEYHLLLMVTTRSPTSLSWSDLASVSRISLNRLPVEETQQAIKSLLPANVVSNNPEWLHLISDTTGGIPLFIEEFCHWMSENASTSERPPNATVPYPSSFDAIVTARLDRIGAAKEIAGAAAVAGRHFDAGIVSQLLPEMSERKVHQGLTALEHAEFIFRNRAPGMPTYSFRHALVQEAIYNSLLRATRRVMHKRLVACVTASRGLAPWMETATIADHAERAELIESAIMFYIAAGKESSALSALTEAKHLLERALKLSERLIDVSQCDSLRLGALSALGPVLMTLEGSMSPRACAVYDQGVEIARRRPAQEQSKWFPLYWGWWFTGSDFSMQRERAQTVVKDLANVADPEIQLQIKHCVWAIDFNMGFHESTISAVNEGLTLYQSGHGAETRTLYGGHDARVCGLGQRGLALWFCGDDANAVASVTEAKRWAQQIGHVGSIAHVLDIEAMLHRYRRDVTVLRRTLDSMRQLSSMHGLPSLAAKASIFSGWCDALCGQPDKGRVLFDDGVATLREIETIEDFPVYCDMQAEIMALTNSVEAGLEVISTAIADAERTGHRYWLAELYHRRARLLLQLSADGDAIRDSIGRSLQIASDQNAVPLLVGTFATLSSSGISAELSTEYRARATTASQYLSRNACSSADRLAQTATDSG
jgi:predicted ATPase/class 3 adenylate cyclase